MGANEVVEVDQKRLGRLPLKTTRKALQFSDFFKFVDIPKATNFWTRRAAVAKRTFGNTQCGDCTRAKQAYAIMRMERLEQKRTVSISDEEVKRVYFDMTQRLYGGGDTGAYEDDALNEWRNPTTTIRDTAGKPYTIDAYLRINAMNPAEVKAGLALSGAHGIAVCFNLPAALSGKSVWDVPDGQPLVGEWMPGSWGGHSMWMIDYDETDKINAFDIVDDTWAEGPRKITARACAAYMDEAHLVIDSVDTWRKQTSSRKIKSALGDVVDAVNAVSDIRITL